MRRTITQILVAFAVGNIVFGLLLLFVHSYTIVPLIEWLRTFTQQQLEMLFSFAAKAEIALGLVLLVIAALMGRRSLDK
jgi:hypothetical protein